MKQHLWLEFKRGKKSHIYMLYKEDLDVLERQPERFGKIMLQNPNNRDRSRNVDVEVHCLRDLVRNGHSKLAKCAGTQNVSDTLTKSLPRPAYEKH